MIFEYSAGKQVVFSMDTVSRVRCYFYFNHSIIIDNNQYKTLLFTLGVTLFYYMLTQQSKSGASLIPRILVTYLCKTN